MRTQYTQVRCLKKRTMYDKVTVYAILAEGLDICLSVTLVDGFVLGFNAAID